MKIITRKDPEKFRKRSTKWAKENPEKRCIIQRRRRARKLKAGGDHTLDDIKELLEKQKYKCIYCKTNLKNGYQVDHIKPLSKGGDNSKFNLQILCISCNQRKSAKDPIEYAQSIGLLL